MQDSDHFILSPGGAPDASNASLERERLRGGVPSAGFEGSKPWGTGSRDTRLAQLRSHAQVGGCVFVATLLMIAAIAVAAHVFGREGRDSNSGEHAENYAHFYVVRSQARDNLLLRHVVGKLCGKMATSYEGEICVFQYNRV